MSITETVLEMHYHRPLIELFRDTFGIGKSGSINFYKYSQQKERFVGFDQAFVKTELSMDEFYRYLKQASQADYRLQDFMFGYFLQYKVVKAMKRRSRKTPPQIRNHSHYRITLDTSKKNNKLPQHEVLYKLNTNPAAMVYYACPMLFDREELYDLDPDLENLRLADFDDCTDQYTDNDTHHIFFNDKGDIPVWCSDPVEGKAISPEGLVELIRSRYSRWLERDSENEIPDPSNFELVFEALGKIREEINDVKGDLFSENTNPFSLVDNTLTLIKITPSASAFS